MVLFCCVVNCGSRGQRDPVKFFRIPAELHHKHKTELNELSSLRRKKWLSAIKRKDLDDKKAKYAVVCSKHFITSKPADLKDSLNPDWIPSLNMGYVSESEMSPATKLRRYKQKRIGIEFQASTSRCSPELMQIEESHDEDIISEQNKQIQTEMTSVDITNLNLRLHAALKNQEKLQNRVITCENLKHSNRQLRYYTGLSTYKHFEIVLQLTEPYIKNTLNTALPVKEQILLTLMKLRLNLDFKDLAFRFGVSATTASTYFKTIIHAMCSRLKIFVSWPKREILKKTMPRCFREAFHENTTVIVDCFEIRTQTPSHMLTAAQSWSNYKHYQTVKYLIGITPQCSICFISEGWGGRVSDKALTENSTFLNNLIPGDVVMADRGFLIKEFVEIFGATVKVPGFTRGKTQLHPVDLEKTRSIASCRIHVERVIGMLRQKFNILNDVVSIVMLSTGGDEPILDKIAFVCCALNNLCPSIIN